MGLVAVILISALFGGLLYYLAARRGCNKQFWLIMGILFGPFALPFIFWAKKRPMISHSANVQPLLWDYHTNFQPVL